MTAYPWNVESLEIRLGAFRIESATRTQSTEDDLAAMRAADDGYDLARLETMRGLLQGLRRSSLDVKLPQSRPRAGPPSAGFALAPRPGRARAPSRGRRGRAAS